MATLGHLLWVTETLGGGAGTRLQGTLLSPLHSADGRVSGQGGCVDELSDLSQSCGLQV